MPERACYRVAHVVNPLCIRATDDPVGILIIVHRAYFHRLSGADKGLGVLFRYDHFPSSLNDLQGAGNLQTSQHAQAKNYVFHDFLLLFNVCLYGLNIHYFTDSTIQKIL